MTVLSQVLELLVRADLATETSYRSGYIDALREVVEIIGEEAGVLIEEKA